MNMQKFFAHIRENLYGGILLQSNVDGINAILHVAASVGVTNPHHIANILAQVHHETGGYMLPIKETVQASHTDKNPSDAEVIRRLDNAFAAGKLPWVKKPYWRTGWFGRGQIQISHENNYKKLGDAIGVNLVADRDRALELEVSAAIAVVGMTRGLFTGKKLGDYIFPLALKSEPKTNPRRIVNGVDGSDAEVAGSHMLFYSALMAAGFGQEVTPAPAPEPEPTPEPEGRSVEEIVADIEVLLNELKSKV